MVGTLAGWDQHPFQQTVVDGYSTHLQWTRPAYNCWAAIRGRPHLPKPGEAFRPLMAALPVVENNDPRLFEALLDTLLARATKRPCDYLMIGLHETDALLPVVLGRATTTYVTRLYYACWEDGDPLRIRLDGRPPYLELGCL